MAVSRQSRLAVLIDGENVSPLAADEIMAGAQSRGDVVVRRVFGDWQRSGVCGWRNAALKWALETIQQCSHSPGDGAADVGLAIAAMDLVYSGRVEGFCLASGDGDFTPLAVRLRSAGLAVFGFGPAQAAKPFRLACTEFVALKSLGAKAPKQKKTAAATEPAPIDPTVVELLAEAVATNADEDGWTELGRIGQYLRRQVEGYAVKKLGASSISKVLRRAGGFEVVTGGGSGRARLVTPHLASVEDDAIAS